MRWFINDLSLEGQFQTANDFLIALDALIELRARSRLVRETLFCTRDLSQRPVSNERTLAAVVGSQAPREKRHLILSWLTTRGPFIDADRQLEDDDFFSFEGCDVTDQGLGEAARRSKAGQAAGAFSFRGGQRINFIRDPLMVQHGLDESPFGHVAVVNEWEPARLEARTVASLPMPLTWQALTERCQLSFGRLILPDAVLQRLAAETFYSNVAERTLALLAVLDAYMGDRSVDGVEGTRACELRVQHFVGEKAWFTDESDRNKHDFESEMTFQDPTNADRRIFCPWHGKIKAPQFRIHFEWPVPVGQDRLKIVYIGPKITKR
jgi:hypothetical protein